MSSNAIIEYSEEYVEGCFYAWFSAGRPRFGANAGSKIMEKLPPDEKGRKPSLTTVRAWMEKYNWDERADALEAEVSVKMDKLAIGERVKTLRELAAAGKKMKDKGLEFLDTSEPFKDNPAAAVRAVISGAEMEYKYAGQAELLLNVTSMSDKQIQQKVAQLLGKNENEIIDAESEDVSPSEDVEPDDNE